MKQKLLAAVLSGVLLTSLVGCGSSTSAAASENASSSSASAASTSSASNMKLGVVLKTTASEYWGYVIAGIRQAEKDMGNVDVVVVGASSDTSFDEQMNIIETMVGANEVQAMAIAPLQPDMAANALVNAKIPIIAADTNFDGAETFIGTAHETAAYQGGEYVADKIGKGGKVVVLANVQGEATSEARVKGYTEALEKGGCEILTTLYTEGTGDKAVDKMEGALQNYSDIDAVVCCADDVALGAARAIAGANRQEEGIIVCGFDGISSGVQAVMDGQISCTVAQDPYNIGYQCVQSLVDVVNGKKLDAFVDTGCKVITPENAKEYLDKLNSLSSGS